MGNKEGRNGTIEHRVTSLEASIKYIVETIGEIKQNVTNELPHKIDSINERLGNITTDIGRRFQEHQQRDDATFARRDNSWSEKFLLWAGGVIGAAVLVAIVAFIISGGLKR